MKRPLGITILAILAGFAGISSVFTALQMLGLFRSSWVLDFFGTSILGAIMWGLLAFIYFWLVKMLWDVDPRGWFFVVMLSALNLIMAVLSIIGHSTWQAMLPAIIMNGIVLLYCLIPNVRAAFGTQNY